MEASCGKQELRKIGGHDGGGLICEQKTKTRTGKGKQKRLCKQLTDDSRLTRANRGAHRNSCWRAVARARSRMETFPGIQSSTTARICSNNRCYTPPNCLTSSLRPTTHVVDRAGNASRFFELKDERLMVRSRMSNARLEADTGIEAFHLVASDLQWQVDVAIAPGKSRAASSTTVSRFRR